MYILSLGMLSVIFHSTVKLNIWRTHFEILEHFKTQNPFLDLEITAYL